MKDLFYGNHYLIGGGPGRKDEERSHLALPAVVDVAPMHFSYGLREIGGFQVSDKKAVRAQEEGIIDPAGVAKGVDHLRPHFAVSGFVFFEPILADV